MQSSGYNTLWGYFHGPYDLQSPSKRLKLSSCGSNICGIPDALEHRQCGATFKDVRTLRRHVRETHFKREPRFYGSEWVVEEGNAQPCSPEEKTAAQEVLHNYVLNGAFREARFKSAVNASENSGPITQLIEQFELRRRQHSVFALEHPHGFRNHNAVLGLSRQRKKPASRGKGRGLASIRRATEPISGSISGINRMPTPDTTPASPEPQPEPEPEPEPKPKPSIIWVACTDALQESSRVTDRDTANITACGDTKFYETYSPWFELGNVETLASKLGTYFADFEDNTRRPVIAEGVVTMEILRLQWLREVHYSSWNNLCCLIKSASTSLTLANSIIYLYPASHQLGKRRQMLQISDQISFWNELHGGKLRVFPSTIELMQETCKIGDVRALDEIANASSTPLAYRYRPITCFGVCTCVLQHQKRSVMKRANSSCADHVNVIDGSDSHLTCFTAASDTDIGRTPDRLTHWFHQEFVDTFASCGEFRVFIVAESTPTGLRGLKGRVISVAHTVSSGGASLGRPILLNCVQATDMTLQQLELHSLSLQKLHDFALFIYERLRTRSDGHRNFESLEIGVRLDVAVSPGSRDGFFVNEITRVYFGDFLSEMTLAPPYHQICEAYAKAINVYFT